VVDDIGGIIFSKEEKSMDENFESELQRLINRYSKENDSNTPDFILMQYLTACLAAWNTATQQRETWYGRGARSKTIIEGE
jgi:hypothetical protein